MDTGEKLSRSVDISERITRVLQHRLQTATERFRERTQEAAQGMQPAAAAWMAWPQYAIDCAQRAVIFWDTLRQRGNNYLEHVQQGPATGAALQVRDGDGRAHAASGRSTTRCCASSRPKA